MPSQVLIKPPSGYTLDEPKQSGPIAPPPGYTIDSPEHEEAAEKTPTLGDQIVNFGVGAGKGLASTLSNIGSLLTRGEEDLYAPGGNEGVSQRVAPLVEPHGTAQSLGKGAEQAAEFLVPAGAEEKVGQLAAEALPKAARYIAPLARTAASGIGAGLVNKTQGGSFGEGAATGLIGGTLAEGMRAAAPKLAETAIAIRKNDRLYGRTPGEAILKETSGVRPGTVAESAEKRINDLVHNYESMAAGSTTPVSLAPARKVIADAIDQATRENNAKALAQLEPYKRQLGTSVATGLPLAENQTPIGALNLKRGLGDAVSTWNPETSKGVTSTAKRAYRALDEGLDSAVPGGADVNQRISSLIPVAKRAESTARNASTGQRIAGRIAAHTGAATGAYIGGEEGYHKAGIPGAVTGAALGLTVPEILSSPTARMIAARGLNSPAIRQGVRPLVQGAALQHDRATE